MHKHLGVELARSREQDIADRTRYAFHVAELKAQRRAEAQAQRRLRPWKFAWLAVVRRWISRPQPGEMASDA